jgi:hypothetical protein
MVFSEGRNFENRLSSRAVTQACWAKEHSRLRRITKSDGSFLARLKSRQVSRNSDREGSSQLSAACPVAGSIHSVSSVSSSADTSL